MRPRCRSVSRLFFSRGFFGRCRRLVDGLVERRGRTAGAWAGSAVAGRARHEESTVTGFWNSVSQLGPEDEPNESDDAYKPLDLIDLQESDVGPDISVED